MGDVSREPPQRQPCPEATANPLSLLFLGWVFPLIYKGWKAPLKDEDLWQLPTSARAAPSSSALISMWKEANAATDLKHRLRHAIFVFVRRPLIITFVLRFVELVLNAVMPIFVNRILVSIETGRPRSDTVRWCFPLLAALLLKAVVASHFFTISLREGMRVRASLQGMLYDKSLKISPSARASCSLGQIVNLMQLDTQRIGDFTQYIHRVWFAPASLLVSSALLIVYLGPSALVGLFGTLLAVPGQTALMRRQAKLQRSFVSISDRRVKLMNEVLQGIKAVKMYAWEGPFENAVRKERSNEIAKLSSLIWIRAVFSSVMMSLPTLIGVITFTFYTSVFKNELVASEIFTGVALLSQLRSPVATFPMAMNALIDARLGVKRIERFLDMEETAQSSEAKGSSGEWRQDNSDHGTTIETDSSPLPTPPQVIIKGGEFKWGDISKDVLKVGGRKGLLGFLRLPKRRKLDATKEANGEKNEDGDLDDSEPKLGFALKAGDLHFKPAELIAVVGQVASGKSSLFHAIIGEMRKVSGNVTLHGSVAYVAQTAWILNDTLRNNILFGKPYDEVLYNRAIEVSALSEDIRVLPAGDLTAIGEKGINLSGGQKQRVSIARAVYSQADVYMFDDPLSALDSRVAEHVFERCISHSGELRGKLRLLITNQAQCLPQCDRIVLLNGGQVTGCGSYDELLPLPTFRILLSEQQNKERDDSAIDESAAIGVAIKADERQAKANILNTVTSYTPGPVQNTLVLDGVKNAGLTLMQKEDQLTGNVNWRTYLKYARSCRGPVSVLLLVVFWSFTAIVQLMVQWWLSYWATDVNENPGEHGLAFYLGIYFALALCVVLVNFIRAVCLFSFALHASKKTHNRMLTSILRAPLTFFDTNPIGRILVRFSRDVQVLDLTLPRLFQQMLTTCLSLLVTYAFIGVLLPPFVAVAVPIGLVFILFQRFFNRSSVELKRLDSTSKSPIYAHFSETLGGLTTLRAYGKEEYFRQENMKAIDVNQRALFCWTVANRWFVLYVELVGALLIFATSLFGVVASTSTNSSIIGLTIAFALQVAPMLGFSVRAVTDVEGQMSSVERSHFYCEELPEEAADEIPGAVPDIWPQAGEIKLNNVVMQYREGLPNVLKGVNVKIKGGQKVGVVGRTGSGKSSLMIALLRLVEINDGTISVDGLDLRNVGLNDLRKRMTIIPQDPVIFSGSIRFNLDPFSEHSDAELWDVLEKSHLKDFVSGLNSGLDAPVSEYGENLSAGQRQMICLTRALLRKSKILIMDEASSSLDLETDRLIQETIRKYMSNATILTIAHRLFTLVDSDHILVMHDGMVVEFDTPEALLHDEGGYFSNLVQALGTSEAAQFVRQVKGQSNQQ